MQIGMVGLGRMGGNMAERLRRAGHDVCTSDPGVGGTAATLAELAGQLAAPRAVWLMVPAGAVTEGAF
jgi:6-phosphogluconate dehydrogenase